jgi:hypothetical protein
MVKKEGEPGIFHKPRVPYRKRSLVSTAEIDRQVEFRLIPPGRNGKRLERAGIAYGMGSTPWPVSSRVDCRLQNRSSMNLAV